MDPLTTRFSVPRIEGFPLGDENVLQSKGQVPSRKGTEIFCDLSVCLINMIRFQDLEISLGPLKTKMIEQFDSCLEGTSAITLDYCLLSGLSVCNDWH
jgi:hypothetical protein